MIGFHEGLTSAFYIWSSCPVSLTRPNSCKLWENKSMNLEVYLDFYIFNFFFLSQKFLNLNLSGKTRLSIIQAANFFLEC